MLKEIYLTLILKRAKLFLFFLIVILLTSIYLSKNFKLDASANSLLIENDPDLNYLREINKKYNSKEFLVLTYTPQKKLTDKSTIKNKIACTIRLETH